MGRNQEMLFGAEEPQISTTQRTSPRTTDMSLKKRREEQYLKAQKKLLQLQREQATRIKAQQSQSKLMQMVLAKQKELEEKRRKKEKEEKQREEEERRRLEEEQSKRRFGLVRDNKENQYQTQFANIDSNEKISVAEERRKHAEEKRKAYEEEKLRLQREEEERRRQKEKEAMLLKKAALEEKKRLLLEEMARRKEKEEALRKEMAYKEKLDRWKSKYQKVSLPTGQKFLDKSTETKILDLNTKSENAEISQSNDKIVEMATTTTSSPEKIAENELENRVGSSVGGSSSLSEVKQNKKIGNPFTQEVCENLRVPCRFVTEHPCCKLPQRIELVGRPRAMDGSADLRWRFMQSRGRQAEGRMIEGFGSNRKSVSMQPVSSSFSVLSRPSPSIPYSHYTSKGVVSVPRYHYNGGPAVTSTILRQCWRLTYLNCARERDHPCCSLNSGRQRSTNLLDRWLSRN